MNTKWFFSIASGEIYNISIDQCHLLDNKQIPLINKPDRCGKCSGRLFTAFNTTTNKFILCSRCTKKFVDTAYLNAKLTDDLKSNN